MLELISAISEYARSIFVLTRETTSMRCVNRHSTIRDTIVHRSEYHFTLEAGITNPSQGVPVSRLNLSSINALLVKKMAVKWLPSGLQCCGN